MKCKIIFNAKTVPTFEDFEKAKDYEGQSHYDIIHKICDNQVYLNQSGYLLTSDNDCYKFEYWKPSIIIENSFYSNLTFSFIDKLKPMLKNSLTFDTLRKANIARIPEFKNSKGEPAHSKPDGSDWSPAQWLQAVIGELGEYANVMKKVERGDLTFDEVKPLIEKELADVMTYLDLLAFRVGVDLSKATENKFNEVSERIGCDLRIENNEVVRKEVNPKTKTYSETYPRNYSILPEAVDFAKLGSGEVTHFSINNRKSYVSSTKEELQEELVKIKEITRAKNEVFRQKYIYSFDFSGIDDGKQYLFYSVKKLNCPIFNYRRSVCKTWLFDYFSKQLGTKIVGMLINGRKENTKLNPGDLIQFYDERNVLYNFRLVKSSDKNVEVSAT